MTPTADLSSRPRLNRSVNKTPLKINGHHYAHGLGVNAWSDVRYYLGGRCSRFTTDVGVDDSVRSRHAGHQGPAVSDDRSLGSWEQFARWDHRYR
jgi:hypothetical protein